MNLDLDALYDKLEHDNQPRFINNEIEPDNHWGEHIRGITLQIDLSEDAQDAVCQYQNELDALEPNNLLFLPRQYQHISVNQVIFWGGMYKNGHDETWRQISDRFLDKFHSLNNVYSSFTITFYRLIATTGAIIYCAYDENDEMNRLRNQLYSVLPFPPETTKRNTFIHTTVARFKNKLQNPKRVLEYLRKNVRQVIMRPKAILLRRENIYPSINTTELERIELA